MIKHRSLALSAFALCAAATPALAGDGTNLYGMFAQDTQMVVVFDVADARDSALVQKGYDKVLAMAPDAQTKLTELGIDPMKDVDTIALAAGGMKDFEDMDRAKSMVMVIEGRLPKDKLDTVAGAKRSTYKGVSIYSKDDSDVAFVGDRLLLTKGGKMKAQIDLAKGKAKGKSLTGSAKGKKMRDTLATTDTTADLWLAVLVPDKARKEMERDGMTALSVSGGANFTANLVMALRIDSDSEDSAAKAVAMIQGQLGQAVSTMQQIGLGKAAKSLSITNEQAAIKIAITFTEAEINAILGLMGSFAGGGGSDFPVAP